MIREETARNIAICYQEIEKANKLLDDMKTELEKTGSPDIRDAFGDKKNLQLGVPTGCDSHRLFRVNPEISVKIIEQHIKDNENILNELNVLAMIETREKETTRIISERDKTGKVFAIENADKPEYMELLKNTSGKTVFFDSEKEALEKVLFLDAIQPVQFVRVKL